MNGLDSGQTELYNNRRHELRAETDFEIAYKTRNCFINSYMLNISKGGLYIETENLYPLDTVVNLKITLPGESDNFDAVGSVVWVNSNGSEKQNKGIGIKFLYLPNEYEEKINRFISYYRIKMEKTPLSENSPAA